ncbi:MAG: YqjF family protein [Candidatus Methylacidiphilales bacterium]|nr:DUF2071 domain-containing protein [Candidatus Methylacidiphilales bacterium]
MPPLDQQRLDARTPPSGKSCVAFQRWESLLFLHWACEPARIQRTLPDGLYADTYADNAYLAVVPIFMRHIRPAYVPPLPWLSYFLELNLRTYVYDRSGTPGIWFYSLDCNRLPAVWAARAGFALPYFHAQMKGSRSEELVTMSCRRRSESRTAHFRYRSCGEAVQAPLGSLEFFLLERYFLFAERNGELERGQISHRPYRYRQADITEYSMEPLMLAGFDDISGPYVHACTADPVDLKTYAPEKCPVHKP